MLIGVKTCSQFDTCCKECNAGIYKQTYYCEPVLNFGDPMRLVTLGPQYNYAYGNFFTKMRDTLLRVRDKNTRLERIPTTASNTQLKSDGCFSCSIEKEVSEIYLDGNISVLVQ